MWKNLFKKIAILEKIWKCCKEYLLTLCREYDEITVRYILIKFYRYCREIRITDLVDFKLQDIKDVIGVIPVPAANNINFNLFRSTIQLNVPRGLPTSIVSPTLHEHSIWLNPPVGYPLTIKYNVSAETLLSGSKWEMGVYDLINSSPAKNQKFD